MSTVYITKETISFADLFDGLLEPYGIREAKPEGSTGERRVLTDGRDYLWVHAAEDGTLGILKRYGANYPEQILRVIEKIFGTDIISEHEPQFWEAAQKPAQRSVLRHEPMFVPVDVYEDWFSTRDPE